MLKLVHLTESCLTRFKEKAEEICGIWPKECRRDVFNSAIDLIACEEEPTFLIELDGDVIGITGWFHEEESKGAAILRWTGVVKEHQQKGIGTKVLSLLREELARREPETRKLIEYVLDEKFMPDVRPFFIKMGFEPVDERLNAGYCWQPFVLRW